MPRSAIPAMQEFQSWRSRSPPPENMWAAIPNKNAAHIVSAMQFFRGLRDHVSLIACTRELVFARHAAAIAAGDRGRAIGRAAGDFVELHLALEAVIQPDHGHAEMQQVGDDREQRGFLAAVLVAVEVKAP